MPRKPSRRTRGVRGNGGGFMATPMASISFVIGALGLASNIAMFGYIYANIESKLEINKTEISRNYKEDEQKLRDMREHYETKLKDMNDRSENNRKDSAASIARIDATIGGMTRLATEVEVIKVQLGTISETMKDVRRTLERGLSSTTNGHKMRPGG